MSLSLSLTPTIDLSILSVQLTTTSILARVNGRKEIDIKDVEECAALFLDARRSAALLSSETVKGFIS